MEFDFLNWRFTVSNVVCPGTYPFNHYNFELIIYSIGTGELLCYKKFSSKQNPNNIDVIFETFERYLKRDKKRAFEMYGIYKRFSRDKSFDYMIQITRAKKLKELLS